MITLTEQDAAWLRENLHPLMDSDEVDYAAQLLSHGSAAPTDPDVITDRCTCNQPDSARDHGHQRGDLGVCRDAIDARRQESARA